MSIQPNSPARSSYSYYNVLNDVSNRVKGEKTRECASVLEQNTKPKSSDFKKVVEKVVDRIRQGNQRELSSWQQQNKKVPLSQTYNLRRSPPNTPVIAKVVSSIIPIRSTQEIDSEIALANEMQQRTRQTTASASQTQSTTRAAARALRREKQASQQAEKATLKKEALDKAWSDLSAFDGFETEKDFVKTTPSDETARINTSHWKDFRKKDHVKILFEKTREERRENQKKHINSLTAAKIENIVVDKLKNFIPSESEIDFLNYAIEKLENNEDHITNPDNFYSEFFRITSDIYMDTISCSHSDESIQWGIRTLKKKIFYHHCFLDGYINLKKNPLILLKIIFMSERDQNEPSKKTANIFLKNLGSLDPQNVISLNKAIQEQEKEWRDKPLSSYSRKIIRLINEEARKITAKITEKHATPETTSQSQKKRIQPKKIQPIRIETEPATVLEEDFSSKTPEDLADEVVRIFTKYTTGTRVVKSKDEAFLNYSVGKDDSLGELLKKPIFSLLNKIISECLFVRSGHPCSDFMEKIKTAIEKIKKERRAQKAIIDQAHRVFACERAKAKKAQKEQAKKAQKEQAKIQKEHRKQDRIAAARARERAKAEEAEKNKVIKMMRSWDLGQPKVEELPETSFPKQRLKVEELPETQIITSDANELHSAIDCLISCGKALHAAREKLQAHVEYPKKLDLFRKFFWMLCSATTWSDKKDELLSDVRHLSEEILSVMTVENLKTIASRVNSDGFYVINVANIFKVSSPPNGVQNHEIWVDSKFVEEALQKIPQ